MPDDGLLNNILENGSVTSGDSFHLNNFNLNDITINNNNSNIFVNSEPELIKVNFSKKCSCDKRKK